MLHSDHAAHGYAVTASPRSESSPLLQAVALAPPYQTVDDALHGLSALEGAFHRLQDRRGIFVTLYRAITQAIKERVEAGFFADARWTAAYLVAFANLYRTALLAFEDGRVAAVPRAWHLSFTLSRAGEGLLLQDILLGVNAHINHDLPLALLAVGIDPSRPQRYADHTAVNNVLCAVFSAIEEHLCALYAPVLLGCEQLLDRCAGRIEERFCGFSLAHAREQAWHQAEALTAAEAGARAQIRDAMDAHALEMGRTVMALSPVPPRLVGALRQRERQQGHWTHHVPSWWPR